MLGWAWTKQFIDKPLINNELFVLAEGFSLWEIWVEVRATLR